MKVLFSPLQSSPSLMPEIKMEHYKQPRTLDISRFGEKDGLSHDLSPASEVKTMRGGRGAMKGHLKIKSRNKRPEPPLLSSQAQVKSQTGLSLDDQLWQC